MTSEDAPSTPSRTEAADRREASCALAFSSLGLGMALWNADDELADANPVFLRRFAFLPQADRWRGVSLGTFLRSLGEAAILVHELEPLGDSGRVLLVGRTLTFTDGQVLRVDGWPMPDGGMVTLFNDVSEAWQSQRALERARDKAAAADQSKSRFLRAANHDLRQPLASMKLLIYACMAAETEEERNEALHAMDVSASIMEDLLGALLNIGQLDAGKVTPQIQTFQVSTVLERLRVQFSHLAKEKGLDLRILPSRAAIESDRALLERILSNFVGNAINYTTVGRVLVGCRRHGKLLRIEVHDTGRGIAEEHREAVFDEFFRVVEQMPARHSLGLGLNIARRLADMLGHRITLRSQLGRGSVFAVDVPLGDIWHSSVGAAEISERIGGEFAGLTCLVLEDDVHLRNALTTLLQRWGIATQVLDSFDAIPAAVAEFSPPPDIVITDYRLRGGVKGTDVVHQINDLLELPCPAIVMTAETGPELIASIRKQGFPVLIKPVSPPALRVIMHNILFEPELVPELS